jgi:hypothetical protein
MIPAVVAAETRKAEKVKEGEWDGDFVAAAAVVVAEGGWV